MDWTRISLFCFFSSYLVAFLLEAALLLKKLSFSRWLALGFAAAGLAAQTAYLLVRSQAAGWVPPLLNSTHDWLLVLSWLAVVLYLFVELIDRQLALGVFVLPIVLVLVGAAHFVSNQHNQDIEKLRNLGMFHASLLVLGMVGVSTSLVASLMYLAQHRRLKHKRAEHEGLHLLSLERLNSLNWWAIVLSVPLLTLGMATGVWLSYLSRETEHPIGLDRPEFLVFGALWAALAALFIWLVLARRPAGRVVAWRTAWACGFLLATMLVLGVFSSGGVHGTG